jgi:hypothetical protein
VVALVVTCTFLLALCILLTIIDIIVLVEEQQGTLYTVSVWLFTHTAYTLMLLVGWILVMEKCIAKLAQMEEQLLLSATSAVVSSVFLVKVNNYKQYLRERQDVFLNVGTEFQQEVFGQYNMDPPPSYSELFESTSQEN